MTRDTAEGLSLTALVAVVALSFFEPRWLAQNAFLNGYVNHEILALLAVILTITMASVANIHLSITRSLQSAIKDVEKRKKVEAKAATPLRNEINSSAWLLFWAFVVCFVVVLIKGQFPKSLTVASMVNGVGIVVTLVNLFVIRDIYKTTFYMASDPIASGANDDQSQTGA